jgi:hypothetical protein
VAEEAEKPKNDQDDYYGPEHGYAFPLSWFKRHIPAKFREAIKQKLWVLGLIGFECAACKFSRILHPWRQGLAIMFGAWMKSIALLD